MVLTIIRSDLVEFMPLLAGLTAVSYVVLLLLRFINPANK
jgi:hypothetical protein